MLRHLFCVLLLSLIGCLPVAAVSAPAFEDTMAQRTLACTSCHGKQGRAGPDGYYPRLAGKPAGYIYNQLLNFRDGRRHYGLMTGLVQPLSDTYLMEIAQYFSAMEAPYPPPVAPIAPEPVLARGRALVTQGDASRKIPACVQCHGPALTGAAPHVPGLLGLPRDYLNAQLGGWQTGQRRAHAPDCMASIAKQMTGQDVSDVAHWLASQPLPRNTKPLAALPPDTSKTPRPDCGSAAQVLTTPQAAAKPAQPLTMQVAQGQYLARAGNCMDCHTLGDGAPFAGGRGIETPFGTVFSSNLTPDPVHGIGGWSSSDFWQAMHEGRSKDARLLYPAFPYTYFTQVTRADSDALFAYLQSLAPSAQPNRAHALRWPYGTQWALSVWRALYFTPGDYKADAAQSAQWNRGAYLVKGLGHCGACHSPRNTLGAVDEKRALAGGMIPMQSWYAPSLLSPLEAGISYENLKDSLLLLKTGASPAGSAMGPMAEVVRHSTRHLSDGDLNAMTHYLRAIAAPPNPGKAPPRSAHTANTPDDKAAASTPQSGAGLYKNHCAQCHGERGKGIEGAYPTLAGNRAVTLSNPANLVQMVLHGGYAPVTKDNPRPFGMPPYVLQFSDKNTADVLTYIRNSWGNQASVVTELDVNQARSTRSR